VKQNIFPVKLIKLKITHYPEHDTNYKYAVGKMQWFKMSKQVVHIITTVLETVNLILIKGTGPRTVHGYDFKISLRLRAMKLSEANSQVSTKLVQFLGALTKHKETA